MKKIRYLSTEEAEWFHDRVLELTGGERGDLAKANLEYALERAKDVGENLERDKAIAKKSAFLLHSLVVHHPFINGNKRTAFEVVDAFIELNGYTVRAGIDETYRLLAEIGSGNMSESEVEHWITTNLAKKKNRARTKP
jgi:death on curing protein